MSRTRQRWTWQGCSAQGHRYFKATTADLRSFPFCGRRADFSEAIRTGAEVYADLTREPVIRTAGVLHATTTPEALAAFYRWRVFEVHGEAVTYADSDGGIRGTVGLRSLTFGDELPRWRVLGPQGQEVEALCRTLPALPEVPTRREWVSIRTRMRKAVADLPHRREALDQALRLSASSQAWRGVDPMLRRAVVTATSLRDLLPGEILTNVNPLIPECISANL